MYFHIVSIFPEIFNSFCESSLIQKAQQQSLICIKTYNPRDWCEDKHKQVDDTVYGGGQGMLLKAEPYLRAVESILTTIQDLSTTRIILLSPSDLFFDQHVATKYAQTYEHIIFICGRYEGIDHRFRLFLQKTYPDIFCTMSLGKFVLLGGEVAAMTMVEAIARLIPGVIKEQMSWEEESYTPKHGLNNIEYPQYTRPRTVRGFEVPDILLSGHHKNIDDRKDSQTSWLDTISQDEGNHDTKKD